jgi:hypothetical protein
MANEISYSGTLRYSKDKAAAAQTISFLADQAGDKYQAGIQTVGTTEEALEQGDVGTIGFVAMRNADDTNYVEIGKTTGVYSIKLEPGEGCRVSWNGTTILAKANTAPCDVDYLIIEA